MQSARLKNALAFANRVCGLTVVVLALPGLGRKRPDSANATGYSWPPHLVIRTRLVTAFAGMSDRVLVIRTYLNRTEWNIGGLVLLRVVLGGVMAVSLLTLRYGSLGMLRTVPVSLKLVLFPT